ncbi:MAG: hypothetical protein IIA00_07365 [Proteobacteria bacterium]|nr:hypothetical protein [Pseudomonadota bacterium]
MFAVSVNYSIVDGAHFFTSDDAKWAGLCAASVNLKDAWNDVAFQLNTLAKLNHGIESPDFQPASSFDEFLADVKAVMADLLAASPPPKSGGVAGAIIPPQIAAWKMEQIAA